MKKVNDVVYLECYTSMGQSSTGYFEIDEVVHRFDQKTGKKYPIYKVADDWYDGRNGSCHSNENSMYYIEL
jgi:hypothetical protein